jgi:hypothetical protein
MTEVERVAFEAGLRETLTGLVVEVSGVVANYNAQVTAAGAQAVIDRLRARDYKIARAE